MHKRSLSASRHTTAAAISRWGSALAAAFLAVVAFAIAQATKRESVTSH